MDVDSLPDDVIVKIFSLLPSVMLIDSIPLVCKRWHQLSKHPDSWRNFNLIVTPDADGPQLIELSRLAKATSYLNMIDFSNVIEMSPPVSSLVNRLLEEPKTVKIIRTFEMTTKRMRTYTKKMLEKFAPSLRGVYITLISPDILTEEFNTSVNKLLTIVSELPLLHTLGFKTIDGADLKNYRGQLGKGCPLLKKFVLESVYQAEGEGNDLIFDVLENKKDQLQVIYLKNFCEPVQKFMDALRACHNVQKLRVPIGIVPAIKNMKQLKCLQLCLNKDLDYIVESDLQKFIENSPVMKNITNLSLCCLSNFTKSPISKCLEAVAERCKDVNVLSIVNIRSGESVQNMLNMSLCKMKHLHTLNIEKCSESPFCCKPEIISQKLKYVKITNLKFSSKTAQKKFEDDWQKLKLSRPQLQAILNSSVVSDYEFDSDDDESYEDDYLDYYDYEEHEFTYFDYLRNKYGEDLSDSELYAFMSSDED